MVKEVRLTPYDGLIEYINADDFDDYELLVDEIKAYGYMFKGRGKQRAKYYAAVSAFDIETTKVQNEKWIPLEMAEMYRYFNITFCWQWKIGNLFFFGRHIERFFDMVHYIDEVIDGHFCIWVHNLSYEYNNLADYFAAATPFFKSTITPVFIDFENVQFRCSAQLTHKSLAQLGKSIDYIKLKDDFDYSVQRTPSTPISPLEFNYCYRDVEILCRYLSREVREYSKSINKPVNIFNLPYTQTGYPRADIKKRWSSTSIGRAVLKETALNIDDYLVTSKAFYGGYTHTNFRHVGRRCFDVGHADLVSAYPAYMLLELYPGKLTRAHVKDVGLYVRNLSREDYAQIATLRLSNVRLRKGCVPYIPVSGKAKYKGLIAENGKVVMADEIEITLTEIDMRLIVDNYTLKIDEIIDLLYSIKKPLPRGVCEVLIDYFKRKTTLKGVDGKEYEYGLSKQMLNGVYGMSAQALLRETFEINEHLEVVAGAPEYKPSKVLPYQWAPYITAYVRRAIYGLVSNLNDKSAFIYSDTDSIFYFKTPEIEQLIADYNATIKARLQLKLREYPDIIPVSPKGKPQYLGLLEDEDDDIAEFCAIGAKRYYIKHSDGFYDVTVSGLSATKAKVDPDTFKRIDNGFNTNRLIRIGKGDLFNAFKLIKDKQVKLPYVEGIDKLTGCNIRGDFSGWVNGEHFKRPCSYVLRPVDTTLSLNKDLFAFLKSEEYDTLY